MSASDRAIPSHLGSASPGTIAPRQIGQRLPHRIDNERLAGLEWSGVILDEAQFVKNHRAKTYQCARRLTAPFKLAITGTPLENSLMDLWALL